MRTQSSTRKPITVKAHALKQVRGAAAWLRSARSDLERNDRIDTLDALRFARRAINSAERAIRQTLPKAVRP